MLIPRSPLGLKHSPDSFNRIRLYWAAAMSFPKGQYRGKWSIVQGSDCNWNQVSSLGRFAHHVCVRFPRKLAEEGWLAKFSWLV